MSCMDIYIIAPEPGTTELDLCECTPKMNPRDASAIDSRKVIDLQLFHILNLLFPFLYHFPTFDKYSTGERFGTMVKGGGI